MQVTNHYANRVVPYLNIWWNIQCWICDLNIIRCQWTGFKSQNIFQDLLSLKSEEEKKLLECLQKIYLSHYTAFYFWRHLSQQYTMSLWLYFYERQEQKHNPGKKNTASPLGAGSLSSYGHSMWLTSIKCHTQIKLTLASSTLHFCTYDHIMCVSKSVFTLPITILLVLNSCQE